MESNIVTTAAVRSALQALSHAQVKELSAISGAAMTTLWAIRSGKRENPGIDTVAKFLPHLKVPA